MKSKDIGDIVRTARIKSKKTKKNVALSLGVTERCIAHWEDGTRNMSIETADKILHEFGYRIEIKKECD